MVEVKPHSDIHCNTFVSNQQAREDLAARWRIVHSAHTRSAHTHSAHTRSAHTRSAHTHSAHTHSAHSFNTNDAQDSNPVIT